MYNAEKTVYYKVQKDNKTAYVLGTIHVGFGKNELPTYILEDLSSAKTFVGESSVEQLEFYEVSATQAAFNKAYKERLESGVKNSSIMSVKAWQFVLRDLSKPPFTDEFLEYVPPSTLLVMLEEKNRRNVLIDRDKAYGLRVERMDLQLMDYAAKLGKYHFALDDFPGIPQSCWDQAAIDSIEEWVNGTKSSGAAAYSEIYDTYALGDEAHVDQFINGSSSEKSRDCILYTRNKNWSEKIMKIDDSTWPLFIAVGVGHLVGEKNLFDFLKLQGFKVTRVLPAR